MACNRHFLWTLLAACLFVGTPAQASEPSERVTSLVEEMTTEEKLGQLVQAAGGRSKNLNSKLTPEELDRVRRGEVGSYLHVAGAAPLAELQRVAVEESRLGIPLLFAMDVVHGYQTIFPVPLAMAATWEPEVWRHAARVSAVEATAAGLHWTFAPMVDIARDARWGRIVEGAGPDPFLSARMAEAQVQGYQGTSLADADTLMAATKHFGAYGAALGGRDYGSADLSARTLWEVYLPPFEAAVRAGTGSMMTAFNDVSGAPVTGSEEYVDSILRDQWGWDGLVVSDWNAIAELINHGVASDRATAGALALRAGVDMDMTSGIFGGELKDAIDADPALLADLDRAVAHILTAKERLGLFDNPMAYHDLAREAELLMAPAHRDAAREAAVQSMVLLKNDGSLPLRPQPRERIAVIGALAADPMTQLGSWRAQGKAEDVVTLLDGIRQGVPDGVDVRYAKGADTGDIEPGDVREAVRLAKRSDHVVLVVGEDYDLSGEARSRSSVELPAAQRNLADAILATGKPVTVLLVTGRPVAVPELADKADAILLTWMLGVEAGPALADVLFGEVSPGGKLPVSFPRATGQLPFTYDKLPSGRPAEPNLERDTNRYIDLPITPLYPFGHGLSYSLFDYGDVVMSAPSVGADGVVTVSVPVTNTGSQAADEVVQLYLRDPVSRVSRPVQQLRGFQRITLQPGETQTVAFDVQPAQMAVWYPDGWLIEAGEIEVMVGSSSTDIRGRASFDVVSTSTSVQSAASIPTGVRVSER
ncbi:MAG: glycoside hydrolase family 3 C-terminal domain-containing protein [Parvularculaceae bacterium]|nr:glycoside hydrolase family 3 C-terminal domain-containing protein [Parvularculaceae bacterium]